jgi:hypothetical protein
MKTEQQYLTTYNGFSIYEEIDNNGQPTGRVSCIGQMFNSVGAAKVWIDDYGDQNNPDDVPPMPPGSSGPKP